MWQICWQVIHIYIYTYIYIYIYIHIYIYVCVTNNGLSPWKVNVCHYRPFNFFPMWTSRIEWLWICSFALTLTVDLPLKVFLQKKKKISLFCKVYKIAICHFIPSEKYYPLIKLKNYWRHSYPFLFFIFIFSMHSLLIYLFQELTCKPVNPSNRIKPNYRHHQFIKNA